MDKLPSYTVLQAFDVDQLDTRHGILSNFILQGSDGNADSIKEAVEDYLNYEEAEFPGNGMVVYRLTLTPVGFVEPPTESKVFYTDRSGNVLRDKTLTIKVRA